MRAPCTLGVGWRRVGVLAVLLWCGTAGTLTGRAGEAAPASVEACWADLAADDAAKAYRAMLALEAVPEQAVALLRERVRPVPVPDPMTPERFVRDLDDDRFEVREKAMRELTKLGELARPALRKALAGKPSPEARRRAEVLLEDLRRGFLAGEELRAWRATEVLEAIGTQPAREVLAGLAEGAPGARLTEEAKACVARLAKRPPRAP